MSGSKCAWCGKEIWIFHKCDPLDERAMRLAEKREVERRVGEREE